MKFIDRIRKLKSDKNARSEERRARVASDLAILISKAGLKRKDVAQRLDITEAALSIRLNGTSNLTLESIGGICDVAGYDFDVVFRSPEAVVSMSSWEIDESCIAPISGDKSLADFSVAQVNVETWMVGLQSRNVTGILHYVVPTFTSVDAANERRVALKKYESEPIAA